MSDEPVVPMKAKQDKPSAASNARPKGLGRGLGALLGETRREEPLVVSAPEGVQSGQQTAGLAMVPIAAIDADPGQPRRHFDERALSELAASIAQRGIIQPVIVRPHRRGRYQLVAGERRWRAAQKARLHEIPAIIRELDDRDVMALALIENLQREDLNPIEEARAYQQLADAQDLTQAEIARLVDKSRSHVANLQRLLALPGLVIGLVETGKLSMGHARALIGCDNAVELAQRAVKDQLSVREVEKLVRNPAGNAAPPKRQKTDRQSADDADIAAVQRHLEEFLGMSVRITADADPKSGAVSIRYETLDQLDLVCQRLTGGAI